MDTESTIKPDVTRPGGVWAHCQGLNVGPKWTKSYLLIDDFGRLRVFESDTAAQSTVSLNLKSMEKEAVAVTAFKVTLKTERGSFRMTFDSAEDRRKLVESMNMFIAINVARVQHQSERPQRVDGGDPFESMMSDDDGGLGALFGGGLESMISQMMGGMMGGMGGSMDGVTLESMMSGGGGGSHGMSRKMEGDGFSMEFEIGNDRSGRSDPTDSELGSTATKSIAKKSGNSHGQFEVESSFKRMEPEHKQNGTRKKEHRRAGPSGIDTVYIFVRKLRNKMNFDGKRILYDFA